MFVPVILLSCIYEIVLTQNNASEQQVRYVADGSGYHSAHTVSTSDTDHQHSTTIALGEKAVELYGQTPQTYGPGNDTSFPNQGHNPLDLYLLQQYPFQTYPQIIPNTQSYMQYSPPPHYYRDGIAPNLYYNSNLHPQQAINYRNGKETKHTDTKYEANDEVIETKENGPVVVFKDSKCKNDETHDTQQSNYMNNVYNSNNDFVDTRTYTQNNINSNFGAREKPVFVTPNPREYQYSTETNYYSTTKPVTLTHDEGISRLVASTQDLISNEDLLRINHAAERAINHYTDDLIKPRRQSVAISFKTNENPQSRITVTGKIGKIVDSNVEHHITDHPSREQRYQPNNEYKFASPIVVEDTYDYKQQILNNFISTMVPYIEDGYQIVDVTKRQNNTYSDQIKSGEELVITPRPVSQHYLTPITVALRLLNDNNTEHNAVDHETSDSEFVEKTVEGPRGKTTVEVQESIPVDITHINDVEYHEYLDQGRSNTPLSGTKSFYQRYVPALDATKQNDYNDKNQEQNLDSNINEDQTQSHSDYDVSYTNDRDKIIQPIIIEKQIPVTTFVDRFIEKPYPERVEVVKQVPVDRPVPVHYETIVEKPVEVTRYIDKPYPIEVLKPYPVEVRVPYPVEHKIYVDRPVHVPYPVEKVIEKQLIHPVPVPTPVGIPIGIPVERRLIYPVPFETPVPVAVPVEKPVEKVVEKKIPVPYPVEKRIPIPVEVPKPYPVDRIVERKVPYPVKQIVEKIVEKPVVFTKYVDKPYPVEKRVPYPVERIVERKVPYPVHVPYEVPYVIENNAHRQEHPYPFERNEKIPTLYSYGVSQQALQNVANYLKLNHENKHTAGQLQALDNTLQETKTNYEIQPANGHVLRNIHNVTPVYTWDNRYASSFNYINTTNKPNQDLTYHGPAPVNTNWDNKSTDRFRRTDRIPKVNNVRIEYGFKPPLIPSTEVDLDGIPVKKNT